MRGRFEIAALLAEPIGLTKWVKKLGKSRYVVLRAGQKLYILVKTDRKNGNF